MLGNIKSTYNIIVISSYSNGGYSRKVSGSSDILFLMVTQRSNF